MYKVHFNSDCFSDISCYYARELKIYNIKCTLAEALNKYLKNEDGH